MTVRDCPREHPSGSSDSEIHTRVISTDAEMEAVYYIRRQVFVEEQSLTGTVYDEPDDRHSVHVIAHQDGKIIGIGRLTFIRDEAQIAWLAVLKEHRRSGAGKAILRHLLAIAGERSSRYVTLNAQTHALGFYESFGFESVGNRFSMSRIEHQFMVRRLDD